MAGLSPVILIALGLLGLTRDGWIWLPALLLAFGLVLVTITLFDYPMRAEFKRAGIERHTPLRSHVISWGDVMVLERFRKRRVGVPRWMNVGRESETRPANLGGLVAVTSKRRYYLLVNRGESQSEFDSLIDSVTAWAPDAVVRASRPHVEVLPTSLYHRRKT